MEQREAFPQGLESSDVHIGGSRSSPVPRDQSRWLRVPSLGRLGRRAAALRGALRALPPYPARARQPLALPAAADHARPLQPLPLRGLRLAPPAGRRTLRVAARTHLQAHDAAGYTQPVLVANHLSVPRLRSSVSRLPTDRAAPTRSRVPHPSEMGEEGAQAVTTRSTDRARWLPGRAGDHDNDLRRMTDSPVGRHLVPLLARARLRRYLSDQGRAESIRSPLATFVGIPTISAAAGTSADLAPQAVKFYSGTSATIHSSRSVQASEPQSRVGSPMAARRSPQRREVRARLARVRGRTPTISDETAGAA